MGISKKGVSGLIVAVLLLAISLTIGGLVIGWISGYTSDSLEGASLAQEQQDACNDLSFKVVAVRATNSTTSSSARCVRFNVTVENQNTADIKGFRIKFVPVSGDYVYTQSNISTTDALGDYARKTYYAHTDGNATAGVTCPISIDSGQSSGMSKVEITPIIDVVADTTVETSCTSKTKVIDKADFSS